MPLILQIKTGSKAGQKVECPSGQEIIVGRAPDRVQVVITDDNFMSSVHFSVRCGPTGCSIADKKSSNGTYLNGDRIEQSQLSNGDEIRSGQTVFQATITRDANVAPLGAPQPLNPPSPSTGPIPRPVLPESAPKSILETQPTPKCIIGSWSFSYIPADWEVKEGIGMLQKASDGGFQSNITAMEERLSGGITLETYVEAQIKMLREYLKEPEIEAAVPPELAGAENSVGVQIRYSTKDGQTVHVHRIYVQNGVFAGVISLTTLHIELSRAKEAFQNILSKATFLPHSM